jgi:hypothetical protein
LDTPTEAGHVVSASIGSQLNEQQHGFVDMAAKRGVWWLWGPPGTGKTTTLAHLLKELRSRGLRTLFVSNTNAAVDTALLRAMELDARRTVGHLARIGQPSSGEVSDHGSGPVLIEAIAAHYGLEVGDLLAETRRQITRVRAEANRLTVILRDPAEAQRRGQFGSPDEDRFELMQRLDDEKIEHQLQLADRELGRLVERRRELDGLVARVRTEIIGRARTVFATVHQTYLASLEGQRFDVVVIDEASMVSADLVLFAAGLGVGHTVLAGDFRQLSPIAQSGTELSKKWLQSSPFERAGVRVAVSRGAPPMNLVALKQQHRMRPKIQELVAGTFYREVGLEAGESIARRPAALPTPIGDEVVVVDTSSLRPAMGRRQGRRSRLNVTHAQVMEVIADSVSEGHSFGAVSPFAPQARLLQALLEGREGHAASTVHRFQGGERDVMAWDMTEGRAGATKMMSWFDAMTPDDEGARLINVALSRARDQLYVVADLDRARAGCRDTSIIRRTLDAAGQRGSVVDARDLIAMGSGRTSLMTAGDRDPLTTALEERTPWIVVWSSEPPSTITATAASGLSAAVGGGCQVYVRSGLPESARQRETLGTLQRLGCQVQLIRPCRENLIITPGSISSSFGNLIATSPAQPWLRTTSSSFAGAVLRMVSRKGDANPALGERDAVCALGHPMLVDKGKEQDSRLCPTCDAPRARASQTGRSRNRSASTAAPRCGSCGAEFDLSGWCRC